MPVQPHDTSNDKLNKAAPDVLNSGRKKSSDDDRSMNDDEESIGVENEPNQANYGFGNNAELDTEGEETEKQEYHADGLPRTNEYSASKTSDKTNEQGERKGKSGCGC